MQKPYLILAQLAAGRISLADAVTLHEAAGSAQAVMEARKDIRQLMPEATGRLVEIMAGDFSNMERRAEEEMKWCEENRVRIITFADKDYPQRLRSCHDAPMVLFVRGKADFNRPYFLNIVGTRKCTTYGQDFIARAITDLKTLCPDVTIVSGLAYGIDITAHRSALSHDITTVGVVAHGQDTLYPYAHRNEANKMSLGNGAVVTEYFRGTRPEPRNFLQRNRIIAGLCDATIIVESAAHGGGLVTARIAQDYGRDVFAVPGPVMAEFSMGCNNLIRDNKAALITSAEDIVNMMQWQNAATIQQARKEGICRQLFVDLTPDEQRIVDALKQHGDCQTTALTLHTQLPISIISSSLFSLEMKGVVKALAGNVYHLIS